MWTTLTTGIEKEEKQRGRKDRGEEKQMIINVIS